MEHPFYVFGQGWSSISPKDTMARYKLPCKDLKLGDLCISLTHKHAERSSSHSLQHIKEETSSPPISQMPKLQPIDLNIDDRSCELIPSYNNTKEIFQVIQMMRENILVPHRPEILWSRRMRLGKASS